MKTIYLLRHAETEHNEQGTKYIGGQSNHVKLTNKGIIQSESLGKYLKEIQLQIDIALCSDSVRTVGTLNIANKYALYPEEKIIHSEKLREQSQGEWEGKLRELIWTEKQLEEIVKDCYNHRAPSGESQADVEKRAFEMIEGYILSKEEVSTALIMTHGNTIRCILRKILGSDPIMNIRIAVDNASISKLIYDDRGWKLQYLNDTHYL